MLIKWNTVYSNKNENITPAHENMDESSEHNVAQMKPHSKEYISYLLFCLHKDKIQAKTDKMNNSWC